MHSTNSPLDLDAAALSDVMTGGYIVSSLYELETFEPQLQGTTRSKNSGIAVNTPDWSLTPGIKNVRNSCCGNTTDGIWVDTDHQDGARPPVCDFSGF